MSNGCIRYVRVYGISGGDIMIITDDLPIGTIIKVVENTQQYKCDRCIIDQMDGNCYIMKCMKVDRTDGKDVYFELQEV